MEYDTKIISKVKETLIRAATTFSPDKKRAYLDAIAAEDNELPRWAMQTILDNALVANKNTSPLCDDTGIPHLVLEIGGKRDVSVKMIESIREGVRQGLRELPGRPMAVKGNEWQRLDQSLGLSEDPADLVASPVLIKTVNEDTVRLHVLMFGGGPEIRGRTLRVFHKHSVDMVLNEIVSWAIEGTELLGCTPCTLAVGVGRSHFEASSMMLFALIDGNYGTQNEMEREITRKVNEAGKGPLGLGGSSTVLATFMKVGPQRASGVRIVCLRPCCCFEPRIASVEL